MLLYTKLRSAEQVCYWSKPLTFFTALLKEIQKCITSYCFNSIYAMNCLLQGKKIQQIVYKINHRLGTYVKWTC